MNLLFVLHTPRRAVRHRNDKGQRTKDKPQAKQSLLRPSRPLESLVKQGVGVELVLAGTELMMADFFTKPVDKTKFLECRDYLLTRAE